MLRMGSVLLLGGLLISFSACRNGYRIGAVPTPPDETPTASVLIESHNQRIQHLETMHARGVVQLEWIDGDGRERSEPQVDLEVWIDRPSRTAFRFDKFGEVYLWAGSDDQRFWLFDLTGEPRHLTIGQHDQALRLQTDAVFAVRPLTLLDLLAVLPMDLERVIAGVARDDQSDAWVLTASSDSGVIRYFFSGRPYRPVRVELLDDAGELALEASFERFETVVLSDRSIDAPQMAEIIRVRDGAGQASMDIFFDEITDGNTTELSRVFDLDRLRRALRPDVVEDGSSQATSG